MSHKSQIAAAATMRGLDRPHLERKVGALNLLPYAGPSRTPGYCLMKSLLRVTLAIPQVVCQAQCFLCLCLGVGHGVQFVATKKEAMELTSAQTSGPPLTEKTRRGTVTFTRTHTTTVSHT